MNEALNGELQMLGSFSDVCQLKEKHLLGLVWVQNLIKKQALTAALYVVTVQNVKLAILPDPKLKDEWSGESNSNKLGTWLLQRPALWLFKLKKSYFKVHFKQVKFICHTPVLRLNVSFQIRSQRKSRHTLHENTSWLKGCSVTI